MRIRFGMSKEEVLKALIAEAEETWGTRRAEELSQTIANTAEELWRLLQYPLDLTDEMPD